MKCDSCALISPGFMGNFSVLSVFCLCVFCVLVEILLCDLNNFVCVIFGV